MDNLSLRDIQLNKPPPNKPSQPTIPKRIAIVYRPIATIDEVFRSKKSPYYIIADPYRESSSGVRVLHSLCHILNNSGCESYLICAGTSNTTSHELWTPLLTSGIAYNHYLSRRAPILIYPESAGDFKLGIGLDVRYVLGKPGFLYASNSDLGACDLLVGYKREFVEELHVDLMLTIPPCDPAIFNPSGLPAGERHGRYFYFNRLLELGGSLSEETNGATEISSRNPRPLRELADIFKRAELLYCYEWGAITAEARMCGCPVACIPNVRMLPKFDDETFGAEGVAWGTSEEAIAEAKATVDQYYPRHVAMFASFPDQLENFIERTQAAALDMDFDTRVPSGFFRDYGGLLSPDDAISPVRNSGKLTPTITDMLKLLVTSLFKRR